MKVESWAAHHDLLDTLHAEARDCLRSGSTYEAVKGAEQQKLVIKQLTYCRSCEKETGRLHWLALDGDLGVLPDTLVGPFCSACLKKQKPLFEHADGSTFNPPVYYVKMTDPFIKALQIEEKATVPTPQMLTAHEDMF